MENKDLAKQYLKEREINPEIADIYKLGFINHKFSLDQTHPEVAYDLGIKDYYSNRIKYDKAMTIPHFDGKDIVGFSFKVFDGDKPYENIRNTSLYKKSDHLYGFSAVEEEIKRNNHLFSSYYLLPTTFYFFLSSAISFLSSELTRFCSWINLCCSWTTLVKTATMSIAPNAFLSIVATVLFPSQVLRLTHHKNSNRSNPNDYYVSKIYYKIFG